MKMILVRHGDTALNGTADTDKIRGWANIPLSADGKKQAESLGHSLKNEPISKVYSSDLDRAAETASAVAKPHGLSVKHTGALRPWDLGKLQGQHSKDVQPQIKSLIDHPDHKPEGGESFNTFKERFLNQVKGIAKDNPGKTVAVVAHHRNDRLMTAWQAAGSKDDNSIDSSKMLQKGIDPGTSREIELES